MNNNKSIVFDVFDLTRLEFKYGDFKFSAPKRKYITFIELNYKDKPFAFMLKNTVAPFGLSKGTYKQYILDLSISKEELISKFNELDEFIINEAHEQVMSWFGEALNKENLRNMYIKSLRQHERFNPILKTKVWTDFENVCKTEFYKTLVKEDGTEHTEELYSHNLDSLLEQIPKNSSCNVIVKFAGVYIRKDRDKGVLFGPIFKLLNTNVFGEAKSNYNHNENSSDSELYLSD
jgi:hypothetical protein